MSDAPTPTPIAGWYPDPAGQGRIQWWDGSQWTENFAEPAAQTAGAPAGPAAASAPAYGTTGGAYGTAYPYSTTVEKPTAPAGTSPYTPFVWVLAFLPLISLVTQILNTLTLDQQIEDSISAQPGDIFSPAYFLSLGLSFLLTAVTVLFGVLDYRALVRAGVPRPFHWAWALFAFVNAPVYIVGRSIIARRRTGSGLIPMVINLAFWLATIVIAIVVASITFTEVFEQMSQTY